MNAIGLRKTLLACASMAVLAATVAKAQDAGDLYRAFIVSAGSLARSSPVFPDRKTERAGFAADALKIGDVEAFYNSYQETAMKWLNEGVLVFDADVMKRGLTKAYADTKEAGQLTYRLAHRGAPLQEHQR